MYYFVTSSSLSSGFMLGIYLVDDLHGLDSLGGRVGCCSYDMM